jgi:uncharacterized protein YggT (Ycf19 family)
MQQEIKIPSYLKISKIIAYIMYAWVFFGGIILALRVFLLAFSANATTPFVDFIYRTSADYLGPFRGIFPAKSIGETGYLDIAAIFAIIIYLLIGWGFASAITYIQSKIDESEAKLLAQAADYPVLKPETKAKKSN